MEFDGDKWCAAITTVGVVKTTLVIDSLGQISFLRMVGLHKFLWFKKWTEILRWGKE